MKFIIVAVAVVLVIVILVRLSRAGLIVVGSGGAQVTGKVARLVTDQAVIISIHNAGKSQALTEITFPRAVLSQLVMQPPEGFQEQALPLTAKERKDPGTVDFVEKFNQTNVRWVGDFPLPETGSAELVIPARRTAWASGALRFQCQRKSALGGATSFFDVDLETGAD